MNIELRGYAKTWHNYIPVFVQKEKKYNNMQYRCTSDFNVTHTNHVSKLKNMGLD